MSDLRNRSVRRKLLRKLRFCDKLEERTLLTASTLQPDLPDAFADLQGSIDQADQSRSIPITISPDVFTLDNGSVVLSWRATEVGSSGFDPAAIEVFDASGNLVPAAVTLDDLPNSTDSLAVTQLAPGNYTLVVSGQNSTTGAFGITASLVGDGDGSRGIESHDLLSLLDQLAVADVFPNSPIDTDADFTGDGALDASDFGLAFQNWGNRTSLDNWRAEVDPSANLTIGNHNGATSESNVRLQGGQLDSLLLKLDFNSDGMIDQQMKLSDIQDGASFVYGTNLIDPQSQLRLEIGDQFGRTLLAAAETTQTSVEQTFSINVPTQTGPIVDTLPSTTSISIQFQEAPAGQNLAGTYLITLTSLDAASMPTTVSFSVDVALRTEIAEVTPGDGEQHVSLNRPVKVRFDNPINPATVDSDSFYVMAGGEKVAGSVEVEGDLKTVAFYPDANWPVSNLMQIYVDGDKIQDAAGLAVDADGDGQLGGLGVFSFSTVGEAEVSSTGVWGYLYDAELSTPGHPVPIVGASVKPQRDYQGATFTDENGYFYLENTPADPFYLEIGFQYVNSPNQTGFHYEAPVIAVQPVPGEMIRLSNANGAPQDLFLPRIYDDQASPLNQGSPTDVQFNSSELDLLGQITPEVPRASWQQFQVEVPANSLFYPDSTPAIQTQLVAMDPSQLPFALPEGTDPRMVFCLSAGDVRELGQRAQLTYPNIDGLAPGTERPVWSYDEGTGQWKIDGRLVVSADGTVLQSDAQGVSALGWKFVGNVPSRMLSWATDLPANEDPGRLFYEVTLTDGFGNVTQQRGQYVGVASSFGLPIGTTYSVKVYSPVLGKWGSASGVIGDLPQTIGNVHLSETDLGDDQDSDGLGAIAEEIIGTSDQLVDSDADGISDLAEVQEWLSPTGDNVYPTGVVGRVKLDFPDQSNYFPGTHLDVEVATLPGDPGHVYAFAAFANTDMGIVDVTDFDNPILISRVSVGSLAREIKLNTSLGLAYVVTGTGELKYIDISNPYQPAVVQTISDLGYLHHVDIFDGWVVVDDSKLTLLDPQTGQLVKQIEIPNQPNPVSELYSTGDQLFVIENEQVLVAIGIQNGNYEVLGSINLPSQPIDVIRYFDKRIFVADDVAYITNAFLAPFSDSAGADAKSQNGYLTIDVSDPSAMSLIADANSPADAHRFVDTTVNGSGLAIVAFDSGLGVFDATDPAQTYQLLDYYPTNGFNQGVALWGGVAFVRNDYGLEVVNYRQFDSAEAPPTVSLDANAYDADPGTQGTQVVEGTKLSFTPVILDDVQVREVQLLVNGNVVASSLSYPWNLTWVAPAWQSGADPTEVQVRAIDTGGNSTLSAPISLQITQDMTAPQFLSLSPAPVAYLGMNDIYLNFSESLDTSVITTGSIEVIDPAQPGTPLTVDGFTVLANGKTIRFHIAEGFPEGDLEVRIHAEDFVDRAGNAIGSGIQTEMLTVIDKPVLTIENAWTAEPSSPIHAFSIKATLSAPANTDVTFMIHDLPGTAQPNVDYSVGSISVTIPRGSTTKWFSISVNGDGVAESDEWLELVAYNVQGAVLPEGALRTNSVVAIRDYNPGPEDRTAYVAQAERLEGNNGDSLMAFNVFLSQAASDPMVFDYQTLGISATEGEDYEGATGSVTFDPGETQKTVYVTIHGDTQVETDELFSLVLTPSIDTAALLATGINSIVGEGRIMDDDSGGGLLPVVSIRPLRQSELTRSREEVSFEITYSQPAESGSGFYVQSQPGTGAQAGELDSPTVFTAGLGLGGSTIFRSFYINNESNTNEPDEWFIMQLSNITGAVFAGGTDRISATAAILDVDSAAESRTVFVSDSELVEGDSGEQMMAFNVELSQPADQPIVLDYQTVDDLATAGQDYTQTSGTVTFLPGQTTAVVYVPVQGDTQAEKEETFSLVLTPADISRPLLNATVGKLAGIGRIMDDDAGDGYLPVLSIRPVIQAEPSADNPSAPSNKFELILSRPVSDYVFFTVTSPDGTATLNSDYSIPETNLYIPPGVTTWTLDIPALYDTNDAEPDEWYTLQLSNVQGAVLAGNMDTATATGTIMANDDVGENRSLYVADTQMYEGDSGQQLMAFTVQLSLPAPVDLAIDYQTIDGTATAGQDYTATSGTLNFLAGQTTATVYVPIQGDTVTETDESFSFVLTPQAGSAAYLTTSAAGLGALGRILDDDAGDGSLPVMSVSAPKFLEPDSGTALMVYEISFSEPITTNITCQLLTRSGTAQQDADFQLSSNTLTMPLGGTKAYFYTEINSDDDILEPDEWFSWEFSNVKGAVLAGGVDRLSATGLILDSSSGDQNRSVFVTDSELIEGDSGTQMMAFSVKLSQAANQDLVFDYQTVDNTAVAGQDYTATSGTLTMVAGQTEATIYVPVLGDTTVEQDETFSLVLTPRAESKALLTSSGAGLAGVGRIMDDDSGDGLLPVLSIQSTSKIEHDSATKNAYFKVTLSKPAANDVTFSYTTRPGTAISDVDYSQLVRTVTISAGNTTGYFIVHPLGDTDVAEPDEWYYLDLYNVNGAVLAGGTNQLEVVGGILDADGGDVNRSVFVANREIQEGDSGLQHMPITVYLSEAAPEALTFQYQTVDGTAVAGQDYLGTSGTLTFLPGQTEATVFVSIGGDTTVEANESFSLVLTPQGIPDGLLTTNPGGLAGVVTIRDDDSGNGTLPILSIHDAFQPEQSTTLYKITFPVTLSEPAATDVTFTYITRPGTALADVDYRQVTGQVTIPAGSTQTTIALDPLGDFDSAEPDEWFTMELINVSGAVFAGNADRESALGLILDQDGGENRSLFVSDAAVLEGDSGPRQMAFKVKLSEPAAESIVFDYQTVDNTAVAGQDYTATGGTLTLLPGQTEAAILVPILGDTTAEPDETFSVVLTPHEASKSLLTTSAAGLAGLGRIMDDDAGDGALPVVSIRDAGRVEQFSPNYHLYFEVTLSEPTDNDVSLFFMTAGGTATSGTDFTDRIWSAAIPAGQTTIDVSIDPLKDTNSTEPDEWFYLQLVSVTGAVFAGDSTSLVATGLILDANGGDVDRSVLVGSGDLQEGDSGTQMMPVTITLSQAADQPVNLDYQTADDSATAGEDYIATSGTVTFLPGQTHATVFVPILGDTTAESNEWFTLEVTPQADSVDLLTANTAGRIGSGLIRNDDVAALTLDRAASASVVTSSDPTKLEAGQVESLLSTAIGWWTTAGIATDTKAVPQIGITDLGGDTLALADGDMIWLDDDAAGLGWFVDRTPEDDLEYQAISGQLVGDTVDSANHVDLLTVLAHELGHLYGLAHDAGNADSVMDAELAAGQRKLPSSEDVDQLFSSGDI